MRWNKWHFQRSELYPLSEVVDACDDRIREGEIIRRDSKKQMVRQWRSTHQRPAFGVRRWIGFGEPRHSIRMVGARSREAPLFQQT